MILILSGTALALTLDEAVKRAAEVDPSALIAALDWKSARLDALEGYAQLGLTPSVSVSESWVGNTRSSSTKLKLSVGALDAPSWFSAAESSAYAQQAKWLSSGATLDAQYAVALLYFAAIEADASVEAARLGEGAATGVLEATQGRVNAGLDSILILHQAETAALVAHAARLEADARRTVARLQLSRALQMDDLGELGAAALPELPGDAQDSPYLRAAQAELDAAKWAHGGDIAGLLPSGSLEATTPPDPLQPTVTLGATWTFDGLIGPFVRERKSALAVQAAEIAYDAAKRDLGRDIASATARARAAQEVAAISRKREAIAADALEIGKSRVSAGLDSALQLLLLQDGLAEARAARVSAELSEATEVLEACRLAGKGW